MSSTAQNYQFSGYSEEKKTEYLIRVSETAVCTHYMPKLTSQFH